MVAELARASVFGVIQEDTVGTLKVLSGATKFIPLKTGAFSMEAAVEELANEELLNDIGPGKSVIGKETPSGSHGCYFKNSEVNGFPEYSLLMASAIGTEVSRATPETCAANADVNKVVVSSGGDYEIGEALLIEDGNGYSIRNVASISTNDLNLNFDVSSAASGVTIGENYMIKPAATGHPSYSSWMYYANGAAIQAVAGCRTTGFNINLDAGTQAEIDFTYEGVKAYYNPVQITSANKYIDFTDDGGTVAATLSEKIYVSTEDLADEVATKMNAVSTDTITCVYSSTTGKFTIANSSGAVLSLLFKTGAHGSDNSDDHAGTVLGFSDAADNTGSLTYTSGTAQSYAAPYTPSYDGADNVVVKNAELLLGDSTNTICRKASALSISVSTPASDVESICAESAVSEKLILSREVTTNASILLEKYEVSLFDKFINNTSLKAMINLGPKDGSGNWVPTKCMNIYFNNATITQHNVSGDDILRLDLVLKGYVSSTSSDVYFNFV
jgi:hypothetical protein